MYVKRVLFANRAPFKYLDLSFDKIDVISLTGFNGTGKTTILSYIVDAFYEIARKAFDQEFDGKKAGKLYRISSDINIIDGADNSLVYICFGLDNKEIHYFDFQGNINEVTFTELMGNVGVDTNNILNFKDIVNQLKQGHRYAKYVSVNNDEASRVFEKNLATYFPSYRYEQPGYLNDVYRVELKFKKQSAFMGYLLNPIEVTSDLPEIANWMMDIILDNQLYPQAPGISEQINQVNALVTSILATKSEKNTRLGIGNRHLGGARIQVIDQDEKMIYPTIFNMSAGESALFCLFGELIKQADRIGKTPDDVEGIVLVDEIDKHLHISMQRVYIPDLMQMFPKVQFIISTHSTFINLGIEEKYGKRSKIIDLNFGGVECKADKNGVFQEAYETMLQENNSYSQAYNEVYALLQANKTPYVITEGKTDWKHIKAAMNVLNSDDINVEFREYEDTLGDINLAKMLKSLSLIPNSRPVIGVFDRDNFDALGIEGLKEKRFIKIDNNVYAFAIPAVHSEEYGTEQISIEHYYKKGDLTKTTSDGRRLFLGEEFYDKGISKNMKYITRSKSIDRKTLINGVIDEKVYNINNDPQEKYSIALSKDRFAQLIYDKDEFAAAFDFSSFNKIIDILRKICITINEDAGPVSN